MTTLSQVLNNATEAAAGDIEVSYTKLGTRPVTNLAPELEKKVPAPEPTETAPDKTLFESNALQQCEIRLLMHRQLEAALVTQLDLVQDELRGVRRVIRGDEAMLKIHGETR